MMEKFHPSAALFKRSAGGIAAWSALLVLMATGAVYAFTGYVGFDEAFNLQMPANLVRHGEYATTYQGGQPFDPVITTGPTVLLPIALSFEIFGIGIVPARLIVVLFWLVFVVLLSATAYRLGGWLSMLLVLIWSTFLPFSLDVGLKVMGEIPAMAFLLLGLWVLSQGKDFKGAMLLSGAIVTKNSFLFLLGPLALFYGLRWLLIPGLPRKAMVRSGLSAISGFGLPILAWEAVRGLSLGWVGYRHNWKEFLRLAGVLPGGRDLFPASSFTSRLQTLGIPYGVSDQIILWGVVVLLAAVMLWGLWTSRSGVLMADTRQETRLQWLLNVTGLVFLAWWLFGNRSNWWRHMLPGYILLGLLVSITLVRWLQGMARPGWFTEWRGILPVGLTLGLLFLVFYPVRLRWHSLEFEMKQTYTCQVNLAHQMRTMAEQKAVFGYWGWFQAPELSFLSQLSFYDIAQPNTRHKLTRLASQGYQPYVIVSWVQEDQAKDSLKDEGPFLGEKIQNMCGVKLYQFLVK
jgi:hypothetical protein